MGVGGKQSGKSGFAGPTLHGAPSARCKAYVFSTTGLPLRSSFACLITLDFTKILISQASAPEGSLVRPSGLTPLAQAAGPPLRRRARGRQIRAEKLPKLLKQECRHLTAARLHSSPDFCAVTHLGCSRAYRSADLPARLQSRTQSADCVSHHYRRCNTSDVPPDSAARQNFSHMRSFSGRQKSARVHLTSMPLVPALVRQEGTIRFAMS